MDLSAISEYTWIEERCFTVLGDLHISIIVGGFIVARGHIMWPIELCWDKPEGVWKLSRIRPSTDHAQLKECVTSPLITELGMFFTIYDQLL